MRIVPVLDVMHGLVVHAVRGQREQYLPLKTKFSNTSNPVEVASGLRAEFSFEELYVADLDAIMGGKIDFNLLTRICGIGGLKVMVDAGVKDASDAERLIDAGVRVVIVATETLTSLEELDRILNAVGGGRVSASIDVKNGRVMSRCSRLAGLEPPEAAELLEGRGVKELIMLDLSRVGSESGVGIGLVRGVVDSVGVPVLAGGGVGGLGDLLSLREVGAAGVLLATALHRGRLSRSDIDAVRSGW